MPLCTLWFKYGANQEVISLACHKDLKQEQAASMVFSQLQKMSPTTSKAH